LPLEKERTEETEETEVKGRITTKPTKKDRSEKKSISMDNETKTITTNLHRSGQNICVKSNLVRNRQ
jgi:hypothetical protein